MWSSISLISETGSLKVTLSGRVPGNIICFLINSSNQLWPQRTDLSGPKESFYNQEEIKIGPMYILTDVEVVKWFTRARFRTYSWKFLGLKLRIWRMFLLTHFEHIVSFQLIFKLTPVILWKPTTSLAWIRRITENG